MRLTVKKTSFFHLKICCIVFDAHCTVIAGRRHKIRVQPKLTVGEENLVHVGLEERNCKFNFERDGLEIVANYSQAGCRFECMLRLARERCRCTPWDYPHPPG